MHAEAFVLGRERAALATLEARVALVGEERRLRAASIVDALGVPARARGLAAPACLPAGRSSAASIVDTLRRQAQRFALLDGLALLEVGLGVHTKDKCKL
jgi:hypothetical protein